MSTQIAVRLPDDVAADLDAAVAAGQFESRTAAVVAALVAFVEQYRDEMLAERERQVYAEHPFPAPDEEWVLAPGRRIGQVS